MSKTFKISLAIIIAVAVGGVYYFVHSVAPDMCSMAGNWTKADCESMFFCKMAEPDYSQFDRNAMFLAPLQGQCVSRFYL